MISSLEPKPNNFLKPPQPPPPVVLRGGGGGSGGCNLSREFISIPID
jgi:hypothetical protein